MSTYLSFPLTTLFTKRPIALTRRHPRQDHLHRERRPRFSLAAAFCLFPPPRRDTVLFCTLRHCRLPTVGTDPTPPPAAANYHLAASYLSPRQTEPFADRWARTQCTASSCLRLLVASPPHHSSGEIQAEATVVCLFRYARPVRRESSTCHLCREYSAPTPNQTSLHFFEAPTKPALISKPAGRVWRRVTRCLPIRARARLPRHLQRLLGSCPLCTSLNRHHIWTRPIAN